MYYYIVFFKEFASTVLGYNSYEWLMYETESKDFAIKSARDHNADAFVNITSERFMVYESSKKIKKFVKKDTKLIYPTPENPLFF